jgi:triacylglycerol lipase
MMEQDEYNEEDVSSSPPPPSPPQAAFEGTTNTSNTTNTSTKTLSKTTQNILNGVIGDYLEASGNELAIPMTLFQSDGQPLVLSDDDDALPIKFYPPTGATTTPTTPIRLCILLHGLVNDEGSWAISQEQGGGDYGSFLKRDVENVIPLYLRYNTGLHVSTNGQKLSRLLESLFHKFTQVHPRVAMTPAPTPTLNEEQEEQLQLPEIIFLCHSMGGLVGRSAIHYAVAHRMKWVRRLSTVIFLGTPHQGSYWEQVGNVVSYAIGAIPRPYMKLAAKVANLRSHGIKDLRYGYILDDDWLEQQQDPDVLWTNTKKKVSSKLMDWVAYHVVTGTVTRNPDHVMSQMFGDALVSQSSAKGHSDNADHHLSFAEAQSPESIRMFPGVNHNSLQVDLEVYNQVKAWIEQPPWQRGEPPPLSEWNSNVETRDDPATEMNHREMEDGKVNDLNRMTTRSLPSMDSVEDETMEIKRALNPPIGVGTKRAHCRGTVALVQDAVDAGATAVEGVQDELTDEVYYLLGKITPIAPVVQVVHVIHKGISKSIYNIIRGVNYGAGEVIKYGIETIPDRKKDVSFLQRNVTPNGHGCI